MGIPLESAKSSSEDNFDEPRLPNTAGKSRKSKSSLTAKQSQKKSGRLASDSIGSVSYTHLTLPTMIGV